MRVVYSLKMNNPIPSSGSLLYGNRYQTITLEHVVLYMKEFRSFSEIIDFINKAPNPSQGISELAAFWVREKYQPYGASALVQDIYQDKIKFLVDNKCLTLAALTAIDPEHNLVLIGGLDKQAKHKVREILAAGNALEVIHQYKGHQSEVIDFMVGLIADKLIAGRQTYPFAIKSDQRPSISSRNTIVGHGLPSHMSQSFSDTYAIGKQIIKRSGLENQAFLHSIPTSYNSIGFVPITAKGRVVERLTRELSKKFALALLEECQKAMPLNWPKAYDLAVKTANDFVAEKR